MPDSAQTTQRISLSTCWFSRKFDDGEKMLHEAAAMGFKWVELGHGTGVSLVPGILDAVEAGHIGVSSLHNFCPLPPGVVGAAPNLYQPSSPNSAELDAWVRQTAETIAFAKRLGAPVVVVHAGRIFRFLFDPLRPLRSYVKGRSYVELGKDAGWVRLRDRFLGNMDRLKEKHYDRIRDCLLRVAGLAEEAGVRLGVENREGFCELPFDGDFPALLAPIGDLPVIGFWHDTGHACLKELTGFCRHRELLAATADRIVGFHLHQVSAAGQDHCSLVEPDGWVDFGMVRRFFRAGAPLVLEFSPRVTAADVVASREWLERQLAG